MSKKPKKVSDDSTSHTLHIASDKKERMKMASRVALHTESLAAVTIQRFSRAILGETSLTELTHQLEKLALAAQQGDLARNDSMLMVHAHTLDILFNVLAECAANNLGHYPETAERYMRLAFKAQSQCRAALETLHDLKVPKAVSFVQQTNIAQGPQQVNNGMTPENTRPARECNFAQSKLMGENHAAYSRLDTSTTRTAAPDDSSLAAMVAVDRPQNV